MFQLHPWLSTGQYLCASELVVVVGNHLCEQENANKGRSSQMVQLYQGKEFWDPLSRQDKEAPHQNGSSLQS